MARPRKATKPAPSKKPTVKGKVQSKLPASSGYRAYGLYGNNPWSYPHNGDFRVRPRIVQDTSVSVNATSRSNYVSLSRQLFAQMAILNFGLELICDWAIGNSYDIVYNGPDRDFGKRLEDYANNTWAKNCNVLGPTYNLKNTLKLIIREMIRDGDILQMYVFNRAGLPQLQYVRSHRIGGRNLMEKQIIGGRYDGYNVNDGVIKNDSGAPIAYMVQNSDKPEDDYTLSIKDGVLCYKPIYLDFPRGIPAISSALLDGLSVQELDDFIQRRLKIESLVSLIRKNASGEPTGQMVTWGQEDSTGLSPTVVPPIGVQVMHGGIEYIETEGETKTLASSTPNVEATDYVAGLETKLLSAIGVPHQLIFSPTDISRAPARGISEIFKKTISSTQALVEQFIYPAVVWAIGNAMQDGMLAAPSNDEAWYNYIGFTKPKEFSLDQYNEAKINMEQYKLGLITRDDITSRMGVRSAQVVQTRKQETIELMSAVLEAQQELQAKYPKEADKFTFEKVQNNMQLLTANPLPDNPMPPTTQATHE